MKTSLIKLSLCALLALPLTSCEDFFDNEPDNTDTLEEVFARRKSTLEFLANVYSYIRPPYCWSNETLWAGVSDEIDVTYTDYEISKINLGMLAPDKEALYYGNLWSHYYNGIRAATYFIQNVDQNIELTADEIRKCKAEARGLRAWYYFCLVRQYGPVILLDDDNLISADAPTSEMQLARSSASECFDYIVKECQAVIDMRVLADFRDTALDYGRITNATMAALKARALLYAASPLYNQDQTLPVFKSFRNIDGSLMMDYTDADVTARWQAAADACEVLFKYPGLALYDAGDPYTSYKDLFMKDWNSEIIWAKPAGGFWEQQLASSPRFVSGWSGWGVTQETVDAFFTRTGYPLLEAADGTLYAEDGSYTETGFSTAPGDEGHTQRDTYNMYCNREPRFYVSIAFENMKWISKYNDSQVHFYFGGNTGRTNTENRNYSQTGYLTPKFVDPESDVANGRTQEHAAVLFRLGEFYLNYAEALNEVSYETNKQTILQYINAIRSRAGIPGYGNGVPVPANQDEMREAIRRERRVELCFEEARYFDCCRWTIAHKHFAGPKHGMNANDSRGRDVFFQRTVFETRVFNDYATLWPIPLSDTYKDKNLVQNPQWSSISSSTMDD